MENIPTKNTGDSLTAAEFNQIPDELENAITNTGISLSAGDVSQLSKAIANYVASGDFYTDSGVADAYVLIVQGSKQGPTAHTAGTRVRFIVGNTNTGASTINVNSIGIKNIKTFDGEDPVAGDIPSGVILTLEYDGTDYRLPRPLDFPNIHVQDQKAGSTDGGTSITGLQTRILNTVVENTLPGASLSSNQITLPAGVYRIYASAPMWKVDRHNIRLNNVTDATVEARGSSSYSAATDSTVTHSFINGQKFTLSATKVLELEHYCTIGVASAGLGLYSPDGENQVYADVRIEKVG